MEETCDFLFNKFGSRHGVSREWAVFWSLKGGVDGDNIVVGASGWEGKFNGAVTKWLKHGLKGG